MFTSGAGSIHTTLTGGAAIAAFAAVVLVGKKVRTATGTHGLSFTASAAARVFTGRTGGTSLVASAAVGGALAGVDAQRAAQRLGRKTRNGAVAAQTHLATQTSRPARPTVARIVLGVSTHTATALKARLAQTCVRQRYALTIQTCFSGAAIADEYAAVAGARIVTGCQRNGKDCEEGQLKSSHGFQQELGHLFSDEGRLRRQPRRCVRGA